MSFYEGRRALPDDNDVREPAVTPSPASRGAVAPLPDPQAWLQYRKARPAERLLPVTARWLDGLPADMRPGELATQYPRIANLVALHWSDHTTCAAYFDALLFDHRGGRQGFPDAVQRDLLKLRDRWYNANVT
jgi:hypothetical protein